MKTKHRETKTVTIPPAHRLAGEGADPEMCAVCGEVFKKNEMYRTPDGLMCAEHWKASKYSHK